jgi:hypothetical protein
MESYLKNCFQIRSSDVFFIFLKKIGPSLRVTIIFLILAYVFPVDAMQTNGAECVKRFATLAKKLKEIREKYKFKIETRFAILKSKKEKPSTSKFLDELKSLDLDDLSSSESSEKQDKDSS